jgi:GNAT superfamily N-acetyltransferase
MDVSHTIERRIEQAIATELGALYRSAPEPLKQSLGLHTTTRAGATLVAATQVPNLHFNRVAAFGTMMRARAEDLVAIFAFYQSLNTSFALSLSPLASSAAILDVLRHHGGDIAHHTAILMHTNAPLPTQTPPFVIEQIGVADAHLWSETVVAAFDLPPFMVAWMTATVGQAGWHHYLARQGTTAVATATLYVHQHVGHLGWAATLPQYRGHGAHHALIAHRVRAAQAMGCDVIAVDTTAATTTPDTTSLSNLRRLGFDLLYVRPEYCVTPR